MYARELFDFFVREDGILESQRRTHAARRLGFTRQAVAVWGDIVPPGAALRFRHRFGDAVPLRPEHYDPEAEASSAAGPEAA